MHAVIMGCGRVGLQLTVELSSHGHQVAIIDKNPGAFDKLPPGFEAKTATICASLRVGMMAKRPHFRISE